MGAGSGDGSAPVPWAPPDPGSGPSTSAGPAQPAPPQSWTQPAPQQPWGQQPWGPQPWGQQPWGQQPWGATVPPVDPHEQRRRRRRAVVALASVAALLVAVLGGSALLEDRRADRVRAEVAAELPELRAFVEQERGLPFLEPVDVEVLDDDAFLEALYAEDPDAPEPRADRDAERTLVALGLLEPDVDLDEAVGDSLDEGVVGFYDPRTGRLAVRGRELDPLSRLVLVHELTHALQDQHFDVGRPELDEADDERSTAFRSLVEGDAVRVETAWLLAQPEAVQRELLDAFGPLQEGEGEPVVEALLGFPYTEGPGYVDALLARGGQPALDAAFADPPTTTEQIAYPERDPTTVAVARPDVDGDVVDEGVLGVLGLSLLLEQEGFGLDAADAPDVWAGDRYVTYEDGARTCTVADVAPQPGAREALTGNLRDWAATAADAVVGPGADGTVRLTSCTPA